MVAVRANALVGPDLEFVEDVRFKIGVDGTIIDISKEEKPTTYTFPSSFLLIPGFVNAHVHVGDAYLKDHTYGLSLDEAVGLTGVKHKKLSSSTTEEKISSIRNSLEMQVNNGFTSFIDFREGGLQGINLLKESLLDFPIRGLILGRLDNKASLLEISQQSDGTGFQDVFSLDDVLCEEANILKKNKVGHLNAIHVSESLEVISQSLTSFGRRDIEVAIDRLDLDFVIHATYADENDLQSLKKSNVGVVCCPLSNLYNGLDFPPLKSIIDKGILLGLGTDNVFCSNPDPFRLMAFSLYNTRSTKPLISPKDILKALTVNPGLIIKRKIGQLSVGYSGDFLGFDLNNPNLCFSKDVYTALTMRATPVDIDFQMYKGRLVKWKDQK
ncbi:MAG: amidohydrolase family protein [Candidatus Heimdallarchaeaceae archaeon]